MKTVIRTIFCAAAVALAVVSCRESSGTPNAIEDVNEAVTLPAGALPGAFTVANDGNGNVKKVHFSQGNLIYDSNAEADKWRFYEHQYDYASDYEFDVISLFTWGYDAENSIVPDGHEAYNTIRKSGNLSQSEDWGSRIGDGNTWRTLTTDEWQFLLNARTVNGGNGEGYSYQRATIKTDDGASVYGMVLYPDDYAGTAETFYSRTGWVAAEEAGCVFLPAAGGRYMDGVYTVGESGYYWSSSNYVHNFAFFVYFLDYYVSSISVDYHNVGYSVRLVTEFV